MRGMVSSIPRAPLYEQQTHINATNMKFKPILPATALALCSCRLTLIAVILSALALLAARCAEAGTVYIGNSLTVPNGAEDGIPPLVILGEYSSAGPLATASSATTLPNGTVQDVKFYGQDYDFTLYALSPVAGGPNANEQTFQVAASQSFCGIACAPGFKSCPFQVSRSMPASCWRSVAGDPSTLRIPTTL